MLEDVGRFMQRYGKTIYSTRGGCVPPQPWGVTTQRGKTLYIHILNNEKDGRISNEGLERIEGHLSLLLPKGKYSVKSVKRLATGDALTFRHEAGGTRIFIPARPTTDMTDYILEAALN